MSATVVSFGEWLPDQPALGNPGLTTANNVLPAYGSYKPYKPLAPVRVGSFTLPGTPQGGFVAEVQGANPYMYYAATNNTIYMADPTIGAGTFNARSAGLSSTTPRIECSFAQFDDKIFAARGLDGVQFQTAGSASNFSTVTGLTGARDGKYLFVIGQFLFVANLGSATASASTLEWSAVGDPTNFPTPNSATAIAVQSGEQTLNIADGPIYGGYGGDQYGIVMQSGAVTRVTYVGPPVVFQFDRVDAKKGQQRKYGSAASGQVIYFQASDGFWKTDGVANVPIGAGKIDKTFLAAAADDSTQAITLGAQMDSAFDHINKMILFSFATSTTTQSNKLYAYSTQEDRWASCDQIMRTFIEPSPSTQFDGLYAFDATNVLCKFNGTPLTAIITTGDLELNPGARAYVDGIKPNIESSGTAPVVTLRIGSRSDLSTAPSYTATTTPTTRTGFADFRVDAKYHRAEVQIVGNFDKAIGIEFKAQPSGET